MSSLMQVPMAQLSEFIRKSRESRVQPLMDSNDILAATVGDVVYFTNVANKNLTRTTLPASAVLPWPRQFLVEAVSFVTDPRATLANMRAILSQSFLTFFISDKEYLQLPAFAAPSGLGVSGFADTTNAVTIANATNGIAHTYARLMLKRPGQLIRSVENWRVVQSFPAASTNAATVTCFVYLWGLELRAVQ